FSLGQWQVAEKAFGGPVLSNQVRFSLLARGPERDLLPWAQQNDRIVIAYSPLAQGLLSGRYQDAPPRNFRRFRSEFSAPVRARLQPPLAAMGEVAWRRLATAARGGL